MKAVVEIECENPELVKKSIEPETDNTVELESMENKLVLKIESERIPTLMAGLNSYLRLINTCITND